MNDYQKIFNRWADFSEAQLKEAGVAGAYVELAMRTNDSMWKSKAIEIMDTDTYNAISAIELLKGGDFEGNLRLYESVLIPLITIGRNLSVIKHPDIYRYLVNTVINHCDGYLKKIIYNLHTLSRKVISSKSRAYEHLLTFHYDPLEIAYLNYKWYGQYASKSDLCKLISNLLSALFEYPDVFSEEQKGIIKELVNRFSNSENESAWSVGIRCSKVENDENWKWLYTSRKFDLMCIRPNPILVEDTERFMCLNYHERLLCMDLDVARVQHTMQFEEILNRLEFREYLDTLHRDLPYDTLFNLIKLGYLNIEEISKKTRDNIVAGIQSRLAYDYFISHKDYQTLEMIKLRNQWCGPNVFYRSFLTDEEQKEFLSIIMSLAFDEGANVFLTVLTDILCDSKLVQLYEKELLIAIAKRLSETTKFGVRDYKINEIMQCVLSDEEYQEYSVKQKERKELESLRAEEERAAKKINEIQTRYNECNNYDELLGAYQDFCSSCWYNKSLVQELLLSRVNKVYKDWELTDSGVKLFYTIWDLNLIDFERLQQVMKSREVA